MTIQYCQLFHIDSLVIIYIISLYKCFKDKSQFDIVLAYILCEQTSTVEILKLLA